MIKLINTVAFIILNENNQVLLLKKTNEDFLEKESVPVLTMVKKDEEDISKEEWFIMVSNTEDDEDPRSVIKREIKKEFDCEIRSCDYFNLYFELISENFIKKTTYFYGSLIGEAKIIEDRMILEWIDLEEDVLRELNLPPEQKKALVDFADFLQNKFMQQVD